MTLLDYCTHCLGQLQLMKSREHQNSLEQKVVYKDRAPYSVRVVEPEDLIDRIV